MKKWKKRIAICAVLCCIAGALTGCGKTEDTETDSLVTADTPALLTNIYTGTEIALSDSYSLGDFLYATEDSVVFEVSHWEEVTDEETGESLRKEKNYLYTYNVNSGEETFRDISMDVPENFYVSYRTISSDGSVLRLLNSYDMETGEEDYMLQQCRDGAVVAEIADLESLFPETDKDNFYVNGIVVDGDGYIYLSARTDLLVLTPELTVDFSLAGNDYLQNGTTDANGTVYFESWIDKGRVYIPVDRAERTLGDPVEMPESFYNMNGLFFGGEYTLYAYDDSGIYGYNAGDTDATLLMSFPNSNIAGNISYVQAAPGGRFLIQSTNMLTWETATAIYEKTPDLDLSSITVLQIGGVSIEDSLKQQVVVYNQEHPNVRVVLTEYDDQQKLGQDIRGGLYTPDVLVGSLSMDIYRSLIEDDYFVDLNTYIAADAEINAENLFGMVSNSYTKDGKLYGIPRKLTYRAVIANKELVGDRTGWTVHEFIDCLNNLPDGVSYMSNVTQSNYAAKLFGGSSELLSCFVNWEEKTCSFDSEDFAALLSYIQSLPTEIDSNNETEEELPYGSYTEYRTGKTAAVPLTTRCTEEYIVQNYVYFGKDNMTYIGYPTASGETGTFMQYSTTLYTILSTCRNPDLAWDWIRSYILLETDEIFYEDGLPILKSQFRSLQQPESKKYYIVYYDGGMGWGTGKKELDENGTYRGRRAEIYTSDDIDYESIEKWLDNSGVSMLECFYPEELANIVTEEISAFLSGTRSSQDTADMIQSRVSIYLAEKS